MSYENHLYLLIKGYKVWWVSGYRYYATIFGTSFILFYLFIFLNFFMIAIHIYDALPIYCADAGMG